METEIHRPTADFPVNIWEDLLTTFSQFNPGSEIFEEKHCNLKEVVKESFMASRANPIQNIKFIDALCRLGVSYHFERDIIEQLEKLFDCLDFNLKIRQEEWDLYTVALLFQVFRQFGFKISSDVFEKFKDGTGKFKRHLSVDACGILSLYEAAQWSTQGEDILDGALSFSSSYLKEMSSRCSPHLAIRIKNALKHPYHKGISRIETRQYISYYEEEESCDATLLEFAKIDFNLLQILHREELACVARWHNEMEMKSKVTFTRHRIAESYLWALGTYFEPQYSQARITLSIGFILFTALDDMYDAFGTKEELELFTDTLEKWLPIAPDGIPESMKYLYKLTVEFYDKLEEELEKEGRSGCGFHLKKSLKTATNGYMQEAKWLKKDHTATFEEYTDNAILSSGYYPLIAMTFSGMGDAAKLDAFEWLSSNPKIRVACEIICRFTDDVSINLQQSESLQKLNNGSSRLLEKQKTEDRGNEEERRNHVGFQVTSNIIQKPKFANVKPINKCPNNVPFNFTTKTCNVRILKRDDGIKEKTKREEATLHNSFSALSALDVNKLDDRCRVTIV